MKVGRRPWKVWN